jgi:hypothetical protein
MIGRVDTSLTSDSPQHARDGISTPMASGAVQESYRRERISDIPGYSPFLARTSKTFLTFSVDFLQFQYHGSREYKSKPDSVGFCLSLFISASVIFIRSSQVFPAPYLFVDFQQEIYHSTSHLYSHRSPINDSFHCAKYRSWARRAPTSVPKTTQNNHSCSPSMNSSNI